MKIVGLTPTILVLNDSWWLPYVLESLRGRFEKYVIYDAGSEDGTLNIIDWFTETEPAEFFVRKLPFCIPAVQGAYRNSMLVEAQTEWTFMVDGDEIYAPSALEALSGAFKEVSDSPENKVYGVFSRMEISKNLIQRYTELRTHHRLYRRNAAFRGSHPGEVPIIKQQEKSEIQLSDILCYHFHNAMRSPLEVSVPRRLDRKAQGTYHPGDLVPFNLFEELPILKAPINNFAVSPDLKNLQNVS